MNTCIIYYRVSTKGQEDKWSLPSQKSELTALAEKNNWRILKEYTEVASGKNIKDRVAIQNLINDIPELAPDYVLAVDQDRLSRGNDFWLLKSIFQDANIKIATLSKIIDFDIEEEDLASDILAAAAKYERRKIITRVKRAMKEMIKEGNHLHPPLGYEREGKSLKVNPAEAEIIKKIFDVYIKTCSTLAIHNYLKEHGIKTKAGIDFSYSTILRMLANKTYIGYTSHKRTWFKGKHEPIIDQATFDLSQKIRAANYPGIRGNNYFLKGLIYCSFCGSKMSTQQNLGGYVYYRCIASRRWKEKPCPMSYISKRGVDKYIWNAIIERIKEIQPNLSLEKEQRDIVDNSAYIRKLRKRLRVLETDYYVNEKIDKKRFEELRDNLKMRISELEEDRKEEPIDYSYLSNMDIDSIKDIATLEQKRALPCELIKRITVYPRTKPGFEASRLKVEFYQ